MFLSGLSTALPPHSYSQADVWQAFQNSPQFPLIDPRGRAILKKVLRGTNGIRNRHLSIESLPEGFLIEPDILQERFTAAAPRLATEAASKALHQARLQPADIDGLIISTCTGYLCPGLTSYVGQNLGLRSNVVALDLVGQGCGAAIPNWKTAQALLAREECRHVLSVCVEVCSAAFYLDNDPGVLISACLFGDGAGAAVWSKEPGARHLPQGRRLRADWIASHHTPENRDLLRFEHQGGMLRNILTAQVPSLAAQSASHLLTEGLAANKMQRHEVAQYVWHGGGRDVVAALQEKLSLDSKEVQHTLAVLERVGNVSSPFVYFVLEQTLQDPASLPGKWWVGSFGAGFSSHAALCHVD